MFGEAESESPRLPSPWRANTPESSLQVEAFSVELSSTKSQTAYREWTAQQLNQRLGPTLSQSSSDSQLSVRQSSVFEQGLDSDLEDFLEPTYSVEYLEEYLAGLSVAEQENLALIKERSRGQKKYSSRLNEDSLSAVGLPAEVDKSGHIEYKLKLIAPSPIRLEKLSTQLKWRLVEGGGVAIYELGVLDDGTLIGLSKSDMDETLKTLGSMLTLLSGGDIKIRKTLQIGQSGNSPVVNVFSSFHVEKNEFQDAHSETCLLDLQAKKERVSIQQTPQEHPEMKALARRMKRDERRRQKHPQQEQETKPCKTQEPRASKTRRAEKLTPHAELLKPEGSIKQGEVRYVVEALVIRQAFNQSDSAESIDCDIDDNGWKYLEFDFVGALSKGGV